MTNPATTAFVHQALFYDSPGELLTAAAPALEEGLTAGDAIILACRDDYNTLLADALGPDPRITCIQPTGSYTRPARGAETYRNRVAQRIAAGARHVRMVGEPKPGTRPDALAECARFEAICNAVLAASPLTSTCAFDVQTLPETVIKDLVSVHPFALTPTGRIANPGYVDPATFLRGSAAVRPDPVEQTGPAAQPDAVTDLGQLAALRERLGAVLDHPAVDEKVRVDFLAAVQEVVVNGLMHGAPPVRVRLWTTPDRLVCTVADSGPGFDDPLAGYLRPGDPCGPGAGLWLARQRCDRIEMARTPSGFTVRLTTSSRITDPVAGP